LINKDGQTERMLKESCSCPIEDLEKTIETISYRFLKNLGGKVVQKSPETIRQEPSYEGKVASGWLGVFIQDMNASLAEQFGVAVTEGVLISDIQDDSPAKEAAFERGDILIEYDNKAMSDVNQLRNVVAQTEVGKEVKIKVLRKGNETVLTVKIGEQPITKLRSLYRELSVSQVQSMPNIYIYKKKRWGFYGHSTIKHDYNLKTISGDKVVVDNATGLMWHQCGSSKATVSRKVVEDWMRSLNSRGYAGYHDWRLPTVEEAASLLESSTKKAIDKKLGANRLYIDPVFCNKQKWLWTGDRRHGSKVAWGVDFYLAYVKRGKWLSVNYVRPVRSVE